MRYRHGRGHKRLVSLDIPPARWTMDNPAFTVPEPSVGSVPLLGLLGI